MARTPERIRSAVRVLLQDNRITRPPVRVELIAKNLGVEIRREPLEDEISGALYRDQNRTIIGVNALHSPNRQRFTIAHEIGHFILHPEVRIHIDKGYRIHRDSNSSKAVDRKEIEANQFAAEVLLPEPWIVRDTKKYVSDMENETEIKQLAQIYKVSTQTLAFRLANLQVFDLSA